MYTGTFESLADIQHHYKARSDFLSSSKAVVEKFEVGVPTLPMLTAQAYDTCEPASAQPSTQRQNSL
ncbi:hypothetical protein PISMIDRAFT_681204, partial [Pisolithus microcarpus 441]